MGKKALYLLSGAALLQISGCGAVEGRLAERIQEEFLVSAGESDRDYQEYQIMRAAGQLDEEGLYQEEEEEEEARPGSIRVTFSENAFLRAEYYFDEELTRRVDTEHCYVNPGDSIYMSVKNTGGPDGYTFSGFRIWEWGEDGSRRAQSDIDGSLPLVMTVPQDCESTQLSVAPLGEYRKKILSFTDFYINSGGGKIELNGVWKTDSGEETRDAAAEINPFTSYIVSYDYSSYGDEFYFEKSDPEPFYVSEENGTVQFHKAGGAAGENSEECQDYSVQLHPYIRVKLINNEANIVSSALSAVTGAGGIVTAISVNGETQNVSSKKEQFIEKLRCGDKIGIQVKGGYKATAGGLDADAPRAGVKDGYEYVFTVPQTLETELEIIIRRDTATLGAYRERTVDNGDISVCDASGQPLVPGSEVDDAAQVTVTITPSSGYYITGKKVKDNVYQETMKYEKYVSDIDSIIESHEVKKLCRVTLDADDPWGVCVYKADGREVSGLVELRQGQTIRLEYTLTDEAWQIVRESGGIGSAVAGVFSKNKAAAAIEITEAMDGGVVRRQDYIQIEKK